MTLTVSGGCKTMPYNTTSHDYSCYSSVTELSGEIKINSLNSCSLNMLIPVESKIIELLYLKKLLA